MDKETRRTLRNSLRQTRHNITSEKQAKAAKDLYDIVIKQEFFIEATKIAFYLSFDDEINPMPLIQKALEQGKSCYLPVISDEDLGEMCFVPFRQNTKLFTNKWGISEPSLTQIPLPASSFDLVFVPLVGFDESCFRLGMGKGFYDRTFSFKSLKYNSKPLLAGLAYECQRIEEIPTLNWDLRLETIITPRKIYRPDTT